MNGSVSITWNKYTRVLECTLESRSIGSDCPMHPSQLGDRSREGPGRGFIRCVEDQEAFITSHSGGGCCGPFPSDNLDVRDPCHKSILVPIPPARVPSIDNLEASNQNEDWKL